MIAQALPPLTGASVRFLLATLVLLPWMLLARRGNPWQGWDAKRWGGMLAAAAAGVMGYSTFFMLGLKEVAAGQASLVVALNPAATLLLAGGIGRGQLLLLGCVTCWVAYTLLGKKVLVGVEALTTTATTALLGAIMLTALSLLLEGTSGWQQLPVISGQVWFALVALAFGATALAYAWYFHGVKHLGASVAAGYIALVPPFGVIFSALWLGEELGPSLLIGAAVAVCGMLVMHLGRARMLSR